MNFNQHIHIPYRLILIVILMGGFVACSDMNDPYQSFVEDGEIVYPAKLDSIQIYSGKNRLKMEFYLPADPTVTKAKVFWNTGQDSLEVLFSKEQRQDTVSTVIEGLGEGSHSFNIYTYDKDENKSVGVSVIGRVFGETYVDLLLNRILNSVRRKRGNLFLTWGDPAAEAVGSVVKYTTASDESDSVFVSVDSMQTKILSFKEESSLEYQTMYHPSTAIDTFYTAAATVKLHNIFIVESALSILGDDGHYISTPPVNLIDGNPGNFWNSALSGPNRALPHYVSFDMGETYTVHGFKIVGHPTSNPAAQQQNPKEIIIQFSDDGENWENGEVFTLPFKLQFTNETNVSLSNPVDARYFKIIINSNVGSTEVTNLDEVAVF